MFPKSFPAAIAVITVLTLSLPLPSARAESSRTGSQNRPRPDAQVQVSFWSQWSQWRWALDFLAPAGGAVVVGHPWKAFTGHIGCGMDPDGRTRAVLSTPVGVDGVVLP